MTSAGNHATAQKYANAAWGWAVLGAGCYYFWGWLGAAVPGLLLAGSVWESIKATRRAVKWERVKALSAQHGQAPQARQSAPLQADPYPDQLALVRKYGAVLLSVAGQDLANERLLPATKEELRSALLACLARTQETAGRETLINAFLSLAIFQPGVTSSDLLLSTHAKQIAAETDPAKLQEYAAAVASGRYAELMKRSLQEMQALQGDLARSVLEAAPVD